MDVLCSDKTGTLTKNAITLGDPMPIGAGDAGESLLACGAPGPRRRRRLPAHSRRCTAGCSSRSAGRMPSACGSTRSPGFPSTTPPGSGCWIFGSAASTGMRVIWIACTPRSMPASVRRRAAPARHLPGAVRSRALRRHRHDGGVATRWIGDVAVLSAHGGGVHRVCEVRHRVAFTAVSTGTPIGEHRPFFGHLGHRDDRRDLHVRVGRGCTVAGARIASGVRITSNWPSGYSSQHWSIPFEFT